MRERVRAVAGVAAVLVLATAGCATFGVFETARTAPPGRVQYGGAITPLNIVSASSYGYGYEYPSERETYLFFVPFATLFAKVGVSDRFDLGTIWTFGTPAAVGGSYANYGLPFGPAVSLNGKYQFTRGGGDGALLVAASYYGVSGEGNSEGYYSLGPRLIFSSEQAGSFPYMVNVGASYTGLTTSDGGPSSQGHSLAALAGAGLPFRLGADRAVRIMPELQVSIPLDTGDDMWSGVGLDAFVVSIGISLGYVGAD